MSKYFLGAIIVAIVAGVGALLLLGMGVFLAFQDPANDMDNRQPVPSPNPAANEQEVARAFAERTQAKVVQEIGQPIEGFEPSMFLQVYPGMQEHDFDNVQAVGGIYVFGGDGLEYQERTGGVKTSADQAIDEQGMEQLLENIAARLEVDLAAPTALQDIFASLEPQEP